MSAPPFPLAPGSLTQKSRCVPSSDRLRDSIPRVRASFGILRFQNKPADEPVADIPV